MLDFNDEAKPASTTTHAGAACLNTATCTCTDLDGDGYSTDGGNCGPLDCEDGDALFHPGAGLRAGGQTPRWDA